MKFQAVKVHVDCDHFPLPASLIRMWVKPVYSLVLACVGVAGLAFVLFPDAFVVRANPTLQLLKKHLPDWLALRLIQVFGAFVLLSALFFLYVLYVPL